MKRVLVKSVFEAFDYVMDHYYPYDLDNLAKQKDTYCVISIQDTHTNGLWIVKLFGSTKVKLNSSFLIILLYKVKLFSYA